MPPPFTKPLVDTADMEMVVMPVTMLERTTSSWSSFLRRRARREKQNGNQVMITKGK